VVGLSRKLPCPCSAPTFSLLEGADKNKDQSYFLALLSQDQLRHALFPIGHLAKPDLRALAADARLPNARKKDSQGICFIGEVKMADFLKAYVPDHPGPIVRATDGKVLGEHRGLHYYTLGQRRGIRIPSNTDHAAYVVTGKRAADHALLVAFDGPAAPGLWSSEARLHSLSFIGEAVTAAARIEGRVRYRDPRVAVDLIPERVESCPPAAPGTAVVKFSTPQRALAAGQIMALYRGEELIGGGVFA
jgi:tRNA-specific 2-thiouridylase